MEDSVIPMAQPSRDPSIEHEPHLRDALHQADPSELTAAQCLADEARRYGLDQAVEHTVWDEPALADELAQPLHDRRLTYAEWLDWRIATTPSVRTWWVTLGVVLAAGPWGVVGALFGALFSGIGSGGWSLIAVSVIAPVTEEMMKIAVALWVVEKRPYLFRMPIQIVLAALAGGLAFACIENWMYIHVGAHSGPQVLDIDQATAISINWVLWRWTVCTGLHATCSFLAGLGVARMWSRAMAQRTRPDIAHAAPWIIAAMVCHGLYNGVVTIAEMSGWLQF